MWAAQHGFDITNNSYFIDPWEFNCRNDVRQRPIWIAVQRALRYASSQGVLTVASAGNSRFDLQHKFIDAGSPDDGSGPVEERLINGACLDLPAEAPGVVTVSATGPTNMLSFYSSYGHPADLLRGHGEQRLLRAWPGRRPPGGDRLGPTPGRVEARAPPARASTVCPPSPAVAPLPQKLDLEPQGTLKDRPRPGSPW